MPDLLLRIQQDQVVVTGGCPAQVTGAILEGMWGRHITVVSVRLVGALSSCSVATLLALGCSAEPGPAVSEFPSDYANAVCTAVSRCCSGQSIAFNGAACTDRLEAEVQVSAATPNVRYDSAAAASCMMLLRSTLQSVRAVSHQPAQVCLWGPCRSARCALNFTPFGGQVDYAAC